LEHIRDVTGSWEHAMLGTDFDGFTDPPDDVPDASHLGAVTQMMIDRGLPEVEIKRILGGNALRVLQSGWR
ncbi:MAG: membrane dipeptidase, partial [Gemmatimonadota bacterium]